MICHIWFCYTYIIIALQSGFSSPAESGIMEDLGLSVAAVSSIVPISSFFMINK
jgi:hypothetical protein